MRSDIPDASAPIIRSHVEQLHLLWRIHGRALCPQAPTLVSRSRRWDTATLQSFSALETPESQLAWLDAFSEAWPHETDDL